MSKVGMSQQEVDAQRRQSTIMLSIVVGIMTSYISMYIIGLMEKNQSGGFQAMMDMFTLIKEGKLLFPFTPSVIYGIFIGVFVGLISFFFTDLSDQRKGAYFDDIVAGSGGFMSAKELKKYNEAYIAPDPPALLDEEKYPISFEDTEEEKKNYSQNMIMSNSFCRPINSRKMIGNNNILVVGGAGTGKSRFFIKPNVLQMNASYVITDPSGEMIFSLGKTLKDHGYKIKVFNISDMAHSNCYNPIHYIRDEAGVNMLIQCFITNTTKGEGGGDNQFFVDAEKLLYSACIFYLLEHCNDETKRTFANVLNMINASSVNEQDPSAQSPLDQLFDKLPHSALAWKYYKAFHQAAGKTLKSIIISCVTRMQPFMTPQVINLTKRDELELDKIGDEKTALFIITPQADRTYAFLASMLYSQLFETLYYKGEQQKANGESEQMHIPVRCMMDEFANIGEVPEFPSKLSTMRKYNISASVVLQDISQIESMYKDDWKTLVGNCSSILFLGTQEQNTLEYFSKMLGDMTIKKKGRNMSEGKQKSSGINSQHDKRAVMTPDELGRLSPDECIVYTQNKRPVKDKKYKYERHPYYSQTGDCNNDYGFQYNKLSAYDNASLKGFDMLLIAQTEAKERKARIDANKNSDYEIKTANDLLRDEASEEQKLYNEIRMDCMNQIIQSSSAQKAAIVHVKSIPVEHHYNLVSEMSTMLRKDITIIFSKIPLPGKGERMIGIGVSSDGRDIKEIMQTPYNTPVKVKDKYYITALSKGSDFEEYKKLVLENLKV